MGEYILAERRIPLRGTWDVIVAGGGPAGCAAAAAAAREGVKVLLLEATGALGGMGTSGLVPAWCPFSDNKTMIYRGLAETVFNRCKAGMPHVAPEALNWVPIDAELLKRIYDDLVTGAGADILFNSTVCAVDMDGDRLSTLMVSNKAGLTAYKASVYIDCTGDADLAAWAGCAFGQGDAAGNVQPATHCFTLANVDVFGHRHGRRLRGGTDEVMDDILASGKYPDIPDRHASNVMVGPGVVGFNAGHLWSVDNTDPVSVSKALVQGRKIARAFRDACAEFLPQAFGNAHLVATGSLLGIRETRRITGDYVLTLDDYMARRSFADEICRNCYPVDIHTTREEAEAGDAVEVMHRFENYRKGESHGIPYRSLTPKGLLNVLVAGRCISTDRPVQASTRVMPVCLVMGEAAGVAAAQAVRDTAGDVHAIDTRALRTTLKRHGAYLPDVEDAGLAGIGDPTGLAPVVNKVE